MRRSLEKVISGITLVRASLAFCATLTAWTLSAEETTQYFPDNRIQRTVQYFEPDGWIHWSAIDKAITLKCSGREKPFPAASKAEEISYCGVKGNQVFALQTGKNPIHLVSACLCSKPGPVGIPDKENTWARIGYIDPDVSLHFGLETMVPLGTPDRFLALAPTTGFHKDGKVSVAALFRLNEGVLKLDELVDLPFRKKAQVTEGVRVDLPKRKENEKRVRDCLYFVSSQFSPNLVDPPFLKDHVALVNTRLGLVWFLSLETGRVVRDFDLGRVPDEDLPFLEWTDDFVLGAQPDKQSRLILATREPDLLRFGVTYCFKAKKDPSKSKEYREKFNDFSLSLTTLQWWAIDPSDWSLERLHDHQIYPQVNIPAPYHSGFKFWFDHQGTLQTTWGKKPTKPTP